MSRWACARCGGAVTDDGRQRICVPCGLTPLDCSCAAHPLHDLIAAIRELAEAIRGHDAR